MRTLSAKAKSTFAEDRIPVSQTNMPQVSNQKLDKIIISYVTNKSDANAVKV